MALVRTEREREKCVPVASSEDVVLARVAGREVAQLLAFSMGEATLLATAISELARNMVSYAGGGEIRIRMVSNGTKRGICVVARDQGPGIADIELAMRQGYSTSGGLGIGLPGVRRIMDQFDIASDVGGTTITITKWKD